MSDELDELLQAGYRYALALCRDGPAAEDLVQEAGLRVVRAGRDFTRGYLFTAIRNRFIDEYRRRKVVSFEPLAGREFASKRPDHAEQGAKRDALDRALAVLREEEREALYLHVVEGYSAAEIGEHVGRPRNTVLSWLSRGRAKLRTELTDPSTEEVAS